ncbi:hypothetical protein OC846_004085 [Tilletia horrida]|uniref:Alpha/beta hydrolase fold-3 domain-containing protein n=1 Tax=Tilletia horrida TaxID=155126 RepID=A0AAN6GMW3_9BASI|nr:hypothetical protein OC846_004085 [Tilletia horrida]KAK0564573.1 hypothetical protein OC861_004220 [Tilletia horrida]
MSDKTDPRQMPVLKTRVPPPAPLQDPGAVIGTSRWRLFKYHIFAGILRLACYIAPLYTMHKLKFGFPKGIRVQKTKVPSRDRGRKVGVYIYRPAESNALYQKRLKEGNGKLPVHVSMHGSGFVLPVWGSDCDFCAMVADTLGIVVIDSDYRKGPVHPFPAPLHDVEDVVKWVRGQSEYDGTKISLGGFSAGGNVALSVACILNSQAQASSQTSSSTDTTATSSPRLSVISAVSTLYPACDLSVPPWMRKPIPQSAYDSGLVLPSWSIRFFHGSYIQQGKDYSDWRASPVRADEGLFPPHIFIACGDADKLYEGAEKLIERLHAAGHPDATLLTLNRISHGWDKITSPGKKGWKERELAYKGYLDCLRRGFGDPIPS